MRLIGTLSDRTLSDDNAATGARLALSVCEDPPMPVHLITPQGRLSVPKVRAFTDFAVPRLRSQSARVANDLANSVAAARPDGNG